MAFGRRCVPTAIEMRTNIVQNDAHACSSTQVAVKYPRLAFLATTFAPSTPVPRPTPTGRIVFSLPLTQKVVGYMGRLAPEKGPGLFLAVAARIAELIPSARFVVVGDGPLRPALEAMANRLGLAR